MKNIFVTLLFSMIAFVSFGQNIDENGRTQSQRNAITTPAEPATYLTENKATKSATSFTLNFSLPEGKNSGEIKFFNPSKDEELKSVKVSQRKGSMQFSAADFTLKGVVVGLYADGVLIETSRVYLTQ
ncbi:MAG: hypothetical protein ACOVO2_03895 [Emticicia sp.]|uniref:hypothetical protein n=1 Tax=Emticicia sp. TaxID=1930953 RepID=UPI003BA6F7FD